MPTYSVISVEGCLDAAKRAKIASEIARIHNQVIFTAIAPDCYFVGGSRLKGHQVFVKARSARAALPRVRTNSSRR
jgi:phenylpyruvate tautomerase PptA (4-oxalocrotonate tautomerase family)